MFQTPPATMTVYELFTFFDKRCHVSSVKPPTLPFFGGATAQRTNAPQSVGLLCTRDRPVAETST